MRQDMAETVGLQALGWVAAEEDRLAAFLAQTGARLGDLASGARDPAFLASVLDFVLGGDESVLAFAAAAGLAPEMVGRARAHLPGGEATWSA
jgi:hypothetical protein